MAELGGHLSEHLQSPMCSRTKRSAAAPPQCMPLRSTASSTSCRRGSSCELAKPLAAVMPRIVTSSACFRPAHTSVAGSPDFSTKGTAVDASVACGCSSAEILSCRLAAWAGD